MDLALNNLQRLICHKTQQTKPNQTRGRPPVNSDVKNAEMSKTIIVIIMSPKICKIDYKTWYKKTNGDHRDYSIIKIAHNTEKCPGDLRTLAVTHTPMKTHQLMRKRLKRVK